MAFTAGSIAALEGLAMTCNMALFAGQQALLVSAVKSARVTNLQQVIILDSWLELLVKLQT